MFDRVLSGEEKKFITKMTHSEKAPLLWGIVPILTPYRKRFFYVRRPRCFFMMWFFCPPQKCDIETVLQNDLFLLDFQYLV